MEPCPPESDLVQLREGGLAQGEAERVAAHLDDCESCRALVGELFREGEPGAPAARIGRFVILSTLGAGGMGLVYAAYDPELGRRVALKVLRPDAEPQAQARRARLIAEARAMAQISHPNVRRVFDVGEVDGLAFIAMEHVDGQTLAERLRTARGWKEPLALFTAAGEGLAAAHRAGLTHGDFKPQNVLVDGAGQVLVADFGLAGAMASQGGTPRYLAPERRAGAPAEARSDQFSFCVALDEALPPQGRVPTRIRRAVARGRSTAPEGRFASMDELLKAFAPALAAPWRRAGAVTFGLLVLTGAAWVAHRAEGARWEKCRGAEAAFAATPSFAPLEAYRERWIRLHREACEAAQRGERSPQLLDRQMACLARRLQDVRALTALWTQAGPEAAANLAQASAELPDLSSCSDAAQLLARVAPPPAASAPAVASLREGLARVRALTATGRFADGLAEEGPLHERARALGYPPVASESWLARGQLAFRTGAFAAARDDFAQAAMEGERGADDEGVARAWIAQGEALTRLGRAEDGLQRTDLARAALARIDQPAELEATLEETRGKALQATGRLAEARAAFETSLSLRQRALPPGHPAIASSWKSLGQVALRQGRLEEAAALLTKALELREAALGPDHPDVATVLTELGNAELGLGEDARAGQRFERALALRRRALGPDHPDVATTLVSLAALHRKEGRAEDARKELEVALEIRVRALGAEHPSTQEARAELERLRKTGR